MNSHKLSRNSSIKNNFYRSAFFPRFALKAPPFGMSSGRFQRAAHLNSSQQGRRPNFFILLLGAKNKIKISLFYFSCNFNPNFSNRFFNCCLLASCCKRSLISACSCFILVLKSICSSRLPQTALAIVEGLAQLLTRAGLTRANVAPYPPAGLYPILNRAQRISARLCRFRSVAEKELRHWRLTASVEQ